MTTTIQIDPVDTDEIKDDPANKLGFVEDTLRQLLPEVANDLGVMAAIHSFLFDSVHPCRLPEIEAMLRSKLTTDEALADFLSILSGAKLATTEFDLTTAEQLEQWLDQKSQNQISFFEE